MGLSVEGKIKQILPVEGGTSKAGKEWKKQGFVIDTGAQYNPDVCFSLFGDDKIAMLGNFSAGQEVKVEFNISSREYNGRWFHNIDAWKIDAIGGNAQSGSAPAGMPPPPVSMNPADAASEEDDLPF
jgi:hypothetical protein